MTHAGRPVFSDGAPEHEIPLRQVSVEELFQLTFRQCAHFGCRHFTVFEQQQSRDTTDAIFRRSARVLIDVQFCNGQFA